MMKSGLAPGLHGYRRNDVTEFPSGPDYVRVPGGHHNFSKSAVRSLEVLELFAEAQRPLRAVDISQALELHASSANQLLKTLVDSGYLLFDDRRKSYFPSARLAMFASWLAHLPVGLLHIMIERIQASVDEMAILSFRQGNDMQVAIFKPRPVSPEHVYPGIRFPLLSSGTGFAALTTYDDQEVREIVERAKRYRRDRNVMVDAVEQEVATIRARGYTITYHEAAERTVVAVPFAGPDIPRGAVISISVPTERIGDRPAGIVGIVQREAAACLAYHRGMIDGLSPF
jgi:DNA-binding IclR family transcriptional regulator